MHIGYILALWVIQDKWWHHLLKQLSLFECLSSGMAFMVYSRTATSLTSTAVRTDCCLRCLLTSEHVLGAPLHLQEFYFTVMSFAVCLVSNAVLPMRSLYSINQQVVARCAKRCCNVSHTQERPTNTCFLFHLNLFMQSWCLLLWVF